MSSVNGPIYEVTLSIEPEIIDAFDGWLAEHLEAMLELPGFVKADIFELEEDERGRAQRVAQYYLESEADLEHYLAGPAQAMRQAAIDRFAEQFEATRRILRPTDFDDGELKQVQHCLNCDAALRGQYCASCGQRARSRLISIWELTRDAFGDLFELDSRLWRTLLPLLTRPGKLTRDYLEGRRACFMPPFRTYLVLSILFFLVAFFDPRDDLGVLFEPQAPAAEESEAADAESSVVDPDEILDELEEQGIVGGDDLTREELEETIDAATEGTQFRISAEDGECDIEDIESSDIPLWLAKRLTKERLQLVCARIQADDGSAFLSKMLDNVPAALFILLPLMALVLKILYPLSKRYYVEHLLFVVHYHAFFFLMLILQILFARAGLLVGLPETALTLTLVATSAYIPVYLYKSMRRVYEQGHAITSVKFAMLTLAYFFGFATIMFFAAVFAAFAI